MSNLLETLSRELGTDARNEALRRHPELESMPAEQLIEAVEEILQFQNWPVTTEYCEKALHVLSAGGELGRLAAQYADPTPKGFTPRADEEEFLRTAPLAEVRDYLLAKHQTEAP